MGLDLQEDLRRKMIDLNLLAALQKRSTETGYIHFNYTNKESVATIPLLENFCWVLALFRTRSTEQVAEGKALLEKLLAFEVDGNFPIYLHEYPQCKERVLGLDILPVLHFLLQDFRFALGEKLILSLEKCLHRILSHAYKMDAERPLSKSDRFRLKNYMEPASVGDWTPETKQEWEQALISHQMRPHPELFLKALSQWDKELAVYLGSQPQEGQEPEVSLFDLIMGYYYSYYSARALRINPAHLQASLIQPFSSSPPLAEERASNKTHWVLSAPHTIRWGSLAHAHSLCLETKGLCSRSHCKETIEWQVTLPLEEFQDVIELSLFLNKEAFCRFEVNDRQATTFQLNDSLHLYAIGGQFQIKINLEQGEGRFFGHLLRSNRACQKKKGSFLAEDWQLALRTLCRSPECQLKISLTFIPDSLL